MHATPSFDWLLFDLGGVIIDFTGPADLANLLGDGSDAATVKRRLGQDVPWNAFERGELAADVFARRFLEGWPLGIGPETFLELFATWSNRYLPGAEALLATLKPQARLACLSNTNPLHWRRNLEVFRIGDHFEHCIASHRLGTVKPEPEIYQRALSILAAPPERVAFFDDSAVNVEAARAAGIVAYRVDGVDELRRCLAELGYTVEAGDVDPSGAALV